MVNFRALNRRNTVPDAGIAQMVEQRTCNAKVPSSILGAGTRSQSDWACGGVGEWLKPADCKSVAYGYAGSNPAPSTIFLLQLTLELSINANGVKGLGLLIFF